VDNLTYALKGSLLKEALKGGLQMSKVTAEATKEESEKRESDKRRVKAALEALGLEGFAVYWFGKADRKSEFRGSKSNGGKVVARIQVFFQCLSDKCWVDVRIYDENGSRRRCFVMLQYDSGAFTVIDPGNERQSPLRFGSFARAS
jgi:hypothetical protein